MSNTKYTIRGYKNCKRYARGQGAHTSVPAHERWCYRGSSGGLGIARAEHGLNNLVLLNQKSAHDAADTCDGGDGGNDDDQIIILLLCLGL